jgi:hypothetical protein
MPTFDSGRRKALRAAVALAAAAWAASRRANVLGAATKRALLSGVTVRSDRQNRDWAVRLNPDRAPKTKEAADA